ncbi:hypothetical protein EG329_009025 [Mollisiaceae sp. DMI_Dod_QoI]|nr:hypothetical protein EG329_009025 [Helotiales sp. DMI_Dod_QoI]
MHPPPLALTPALPSELLTYVLAHQVYPTTLIICQSRNTFLATLLSTIPQPIHQISRQTAHAINPHRHPEPQDDDSLPPESQRHPLLIPTLHQITASRQIKLVFIPTVSHLRAYLSVFPSQVDEEGDGRPPELKVDKLGKNAALLIVYGLVDLHRDTSEWSAQGVGNSVAGLVEAGCKGERRIVVIEERKKEGDAGVDVAHGAEESDQPTRKPGWKVWGQRVPMLNGSVRRPGFESEDSAWSGRTIEVGRIFARWFKFGKGDWDIEE